MYVRECTTQALRGGRRHEAGLVHGRDEMFATSANQAESWQRCVMQNNVEAALEREALHVCTVSTQYMQPSVAVKHKVYHIVETVFTGLKPLLHALHRSALAGVSQPSSPHDCALHVQFRRVALQQRAPSCRLVAAFNVGHRHQCRPRCASQQRASSVSLVPSRNPLALWVSV